MFCHECARNHAEAPAVGHCRFCPVALCKEHLVAPFRSSVIPQYGCLHHAELPFLDPRGPEAVRFVRFALADRGA